MASDASRPTTGQASASRRERTVQSFVRRAGRLTRAQARALETLWPRYGIEPAPAEAAPAPLDLDAIFGRRAPRLLEIGFGNGTALLDYAEAAPDWDCLGAEVHPPGVGHCLLEIERRGLGNVRLLMEDAVLVLRDRLAAGSLSGVHLYFPDPWHKKRHHKRRLVQAPFLALLASRLGPGAYFHVATDWPPYAEHIAGLLAESAAFHPAGTRPRSRTRFEARGERLGHPIWEQVYLRG